MRFLFIINFIKFILQDGSKPNFDDYGQLPSWDDETVHDGIFDDGVVHSDAEDSSTLVSQPRQVSFLVLQSDTCYLVL